MATLTPVPPPIAERSDVHKSCKSLESLLNILNEYCEAVSVVVALQKKLAKVLKETAGLRVTGENPANAFNTSASIFEALSEINAKYTKVADKEYDGISLEVKKWFKKLLKEEKAHDERIENANARIKQAGQSYEKKAKKKGVDVSEEHARYINLISTLGPEISQEKYNHSLNITQRHTLTTSNVAACLARIADAEWLRVCEGVRRFAPNIGNLGQWRALCEGGWAQPLPEGLPEGNPGPTEFENESEATFVPEQEHLEPPAISKPAMKSSPKRVTLDIPGNDDRGPSRTPPRYSPITDNEPSPVEPRQPLPSPGRSPQPEERQPLPPPDRPAQPEEAKPQTSARPPPSAFDTLKQPFFDPVTGSVRTLSAFPVPPSHFPLPPPRQGDSLHSAQSSLTTPQLTESPLSSSQILWATNEGQRNVSSSSSHQSQAVKGPQSQPPSPEQQYRPAPARVLEEKRPSTEIQRPVPVRAQSAIPEEPDAPVPGQWGEVPTQAEREGDRFEQEFGIERSSDQNTKYRSYDALRNRPVERTDTGASNGSLVAAMRSRYTGNNTGTTSPTPRDPPRVPLSVPSLASKYEVTGSTSPPVSPRNRAASPPMSRQHSFPLDALHSPLDALRSSPENTRPGHRPGLNSISTSTPAVEEERRRTYDDYAQQELRHRQRELLERERDIEAKSKELERERARLANMREAVGSSNPSGVMDTVAEEPRNDGSRPGISPIRPRRVSLRKQLGRPVSQMDTSEPSPISPTRPRSSYLQGSPSGFGQGRNGEGDFSQQNRSRNSADYREARYGNEAESPSAPHAPYCGCDTCSVAKYRTPSSGTTDTIDSQARNMLRPPISSDKPKAGWMRRLSMPGGLSGAFSLDSKKNTSGGSNYALGTGVSSANVSKGLLSLDGKRNLSTTSLLKSPQEDGRVGGGRRTSYEANRSMTNLAPGSRR
ncbi:hypothetical protein BKA70DRAFT_1277480 [Coprinopsis sp. MPI-PUGE-AT-0042]|nr:hypothetical protein BKA70DRAFT_1277480 [Coprinopsis sp. MPI-PUGE-AT-0042]